jgi:hypothetical protein
MLCPLHRHQILANFLDSKPPDFLVKDYIVLLNCYFRPPNLGNIALPYTLGQGRCDFPYNVKNF